MNPFRHAAFAAAVSLAGCATLPRDHGYAETTQMLRERSGVAPDAVGWSQPQPAAVPVGPLTAAQAVALAFVHNPRIREQYARLGIARGELEDARRLANPVFGFSRLGGGDGSPQITRSLSLAFGELLLLPASRRFATDEFRRIQHLVADDLLQLARDVEIAWYAAVAARQTMEMRALAQEAASASADLAERFYAAGNISRLQLERERAAASEARIAATRTLADALRARSELALLTGLPADGGWNVEPMLPSPPDTRHDAAALVQVAREQRLDLVAARQSSALRENALALARRWRWLGSVEVGFERERESEGVAQGPTLAVGLPIFDQGQGAIAKAAAEREQARAELDARLAAVDSEARLGVQRLNVAREIAGHYRASLLPARQAVVAGTQREYDYMLVGVFELLEARRQEFAAYEEYLAAVRDYWTARAELRRAVGGRLPDDDAVPEPTIGVDAVLPRNEAAPDHSHHDHGGSR